MACRSRRSTEPVDPLAAVKLMLWELEAPGDLARRLDETAPGIVALYGAEELVRLHGVRTGAVFWCLQPCPEDLWEAMAGEANEGHRVNAGDD